jgi:hypothetical protein
MEMDLDRKKIIRPPTAALITKDNARAMAAKRQEKAARLLREAIVTETMDKLEVPHHGSAAAIAAAGGILWREIVLDKDQYARDRLEAFTKLGAIAGVIPNAQQRPEPEKNDGVAGVMAATADLLRELRAVIQPRDVVDGTATDAE